MGEHADYVLIDGHKVAPHLVDEFYNGDDGGRVTDEQWDESKRRLENDNDTVTWKPIAEYDGMS